MTARCLLALLLLAVAARADSVTQAIEKRYNNLRTLKTQFEEKIYAAAAPNRVRRQERGTLYLLRPRKMRWDYADPAGKLFLSDGKMFYLYDPNSNQVQKIPPKQAEDLRAPLAFLLGKLDFSKEFGHITTRTLDGAIELTADARSDKDVFTKAVFTIDPQTWQIRRILVYGQDGLVTDFAFASEVTNAPFEARLFQFTPPPGAEIVEADH